MFNIKANEIIGAVFLIIIGLFIEVFYLFFQAFPTNAISINDNISVALFVVMFPIVLIESSSYI